MSNNVDSDRITISLGLMAIIISIYFGFQQIPTSTSIIYNYVSRLVNFYFFANFIIFAIYVILRGYELKGCPKQKLPFGIYSPNGFLSDFVYDFSINMIIVYPIIALFLSYIYYFPIWLDSNSPYNELIVNIALAIITILLFFVLVKIKEIWNKYMMKRFPNIKICYDCEEKRKKEFFSKLKIKKEK